ncbi:MAG: hypothetical protein ACP5JR_00955 [Thermoplasmata archaeon]
MNAKLKVICAIMLAMLAMSIGAVITVPKGTATEDEDGKISIGADMNYYARGQSVTFTLTNTGNTDLMGTPSITIHTKDGVYVSSVPTPSLMRTLKPGESIQFAWNQKNETGNTVAEDEYVVMAKFGGKYALSTFKIGVGSGKQIYTITVMNHTSGKAEIYVWNSGSTSITGYFHFYIYNSNGDIVYAYTTTKKYTLSPGAYGVHYWNLNSNTGLSVVSGDYCIVSAVTNPTYKSHHAITSELFNL